MKCSNPHCDRSIGLIAHQRGWLSKQRYCSRQCRDTFDLHTRARSPLKRLSRFDIDAGKANVAIAARYH